MKCFLSPAALSRRPLTLVLLLALGFPLSAQTRSGGGSTGKGPSTGQPMPGPSVNPPPAFPSTVTNGPSFITGKVNISDGAPLTDSAVIQSICDGRVHNEGRTDSRGNFSFEVNANQSQMVADQVDGDITGTAFGSGFGQGPGQRSRDLNRCELQAVLPGFTSQTLTLAGKLQGAGTADVGTIVLSRMQQVEGFTISATSAAAPGNAKKEFEKGREDEKKQKWDSAAQHLSKAVEIYPKYAVAWFELGRVQELKKDVDSAKASFQHSIDADPKFVSPYGELVVFAGQEKRWQDVVLLTDQILKLNPLSYPQHWYYNSLANLNLQNPDQAEKSARRGLEVDLQHQVPRLEYMLALALAQKHDYQGALIHLRMYVKLAPKAGDLDTAQKQIAELERTTGSPNAGPK